MSGVGPVVTLVAERGREDFCHSSAARTHAQSHAEIESPRARGPYMAGCDFSAATVVRAAALQLQDVRFLVAYGAPKLMAEPLAQPQPPEGMGVVSRLPS